jgi:hypothetical protein
MDLIFLQSSQERINVLKIGILNDLGEYYGVKDIIMISIILASILSEYLTEPCERGYVHTLSHKDITLFRTVPPKPWLLITQYQLQSTCRKHDVLIMDLRYHAFVKSFADNEMLMKDNQMQISTFNKKSS